MVDLKINSLCNLIELSALEQSTSLPAALEAKHQLAPQQEGQDEKEYYLLTLHTARNPHFIQLGLTAGPLKTSPSAVRLYQFFSFQHKSAGLKLICMLKEDRQMQLLLWNKI